ncbi:MAG: hypothetical protein H6618_04455 [Deltaproteobacteria bacterium]|nr:hypothetical protein [Deltaproteobacteria bacterium]
MEELSEPHTIIKKISPGKELWLVSVDAKKSAILDMINDYQKTTIHFLHDPEALLLHTVAKKSIPFTAVCDHTNKLLSVSEHLPDQE